ncbi:MAG: hypothetical protein FJW34_26540 [Acidobacteria bacterium]|nr:hypothetical protein [Acidobacteriota bacterium]
MLPPLPAESLVRAAMDDIALVVGGAAALHHLSDDLVWTLMKRLDRIRVRLLRDLRGLAPRQECEPAAAQPPRVHAAVDEFLFRNRAGMGE